MNEKEVAHIENIVKAVVAEEAHISASKIDPDANIENHPGIDAAGFIRIIVNIEQRLGIGTFEGNWEFDECTVNGLVRYYTEILF